MKSSSIVIRAYNEAEHIGQLLEGISKQTIKPAEIILVDSGSTDGTLETASQFPVKIVQIQPERFTFGYSLNKGISNANGEFIIIASAHVYPLYPDWIEQLLSPFEDPKVALTYGKQRGDENTKISEQQIFKQWFPDKSIHHQGHPFCNNANAAIRRALWEKHQYNETLTGLEDLEWAKWAISQGYIISYKSESEVIHLHDETLKEIYNRYKREAIAFKQIFPQEKFSLMDFLKLTYSNIFFDLKQASQSNSFLSQFNNILGFRISQFWGTYKGYRHTGSITWNLRKTFYYPNISTQIDTSPRKVQTIIYSENEEKL